VFRAARRACARPLESLDRVPALIVNGVEEATLRFFEFFTVHVRNRNTRADYTRAAGAFLG
jgi:hypothetical protein